MQLPLLNQPDQARRDRSNPRTSQADHDKRRFQARRVVDRDFGPLQRQLAQRRVDRGQFAIRFPRAPRVDRLGRKVRHADDTRPSRLQDTAKTWEEADPRPGPGLDVRDAQSPQFGEESFSVRVAVTVPDCRDGEHAGLREKRGIMPGQPAIPPVSTTGEAWRGRSPGRFLPWRDGLGNELPTPTPCRDGIPGGSWSTPGPPR